MEKLNPTTDGSSKDIVQENILKLKELFPEVFNEDKVDFTKLQETLGQYLEDKEERYNFTWYGKSQARRIAQTPSTGTLRPCKEESKDWDSTQNIFIEGDNLEVLKLLQKSYHKKVKMIYIDPPYNTGKEFIYPDNYHDNLDTYLAYSGQKNSEGYKFSSNSEQSGRFHTNWLNMMFPRLKLARNLLRDDGIIFISINEKEISNLKRIADEIYGEENLLCLFSWRTDGNFDNQAKFKYCHEYILAYAKNEISFPHPPTIDPNTPKTSKIFKPEIRNTIVKNGPKNPPSSITLPIGFPCAFEDGVIEIRDNSWPNFLQKAIVKEWKLFNEVEVYSGWSSKDLILDFISNSCNSVKDAKGQETTFEIIESGAIEAVKQRGESSHVISTLTNLGGPQKASSEVIATGTVFDDYPKPVSLLKYLIQMNHGDDSIVLDFFSGSATTAHALMQLNAEDGGSRKFILVQLPESTIKTDDKGKITETSAYKAGYSTISQVGIARIKGAGEILTKDGKTGDFGFRVFKLDSSNIKAWDADFDNLEQSLFNAVHNVKEDRKEEDVLYELLLKYGLDLTLPIEERTIAGKTVYSIGLGALVICLDSQINLDVVEGIGKLKEELEPEIMRVVFKDSGFKDDVVKTNAIQTLKQYDIIDVKSL